MAPRSTLLHCAPCLCCAALPALPRAPAALCCPCMQAWRRATCASLRWRAWARWGCTAATFALVRQASRTSTTRRGGARVEGGVEFRWTRARASAAGLAGLQGRACGTVADSFCPASHAPALPSPPPHPPALQVRPAEVELIRRDYTANCGWETFLEYGDPRQVGQKRADDWAGALCACPCWLAQPCGEPCTHAQLRPSPLSARCPPQRCLQSRTRDTLHPHAPPAGHPRGPAAPAQGVGRRRRAAAGAAGRRVRGARAARVWHRGGGARPRLQQVPAPGEHRSGGGEAPLRCTIMREGRRCCDARWLSRRVLAAHVAERGTVNE
mgnify:CR=1 FL=1